MGVLYNQSLTIKDNTDIKLSLVFIVHRIYN